MSTIFALAAAGMTETAAGNVSRADNLSELWNSARYTIGTQESLERKYRLERGADVRREHARGGAELVGILRELAAKGDATDREVARDVLGSYAAYARATSDLFDAVDRHDIKRTLDLDHTRTDPVFDIMQKRVEDRAMSEASSARREMADLHSLRQRLAWTTILLSFLASVFLIATLMIVRAYRRRVLTSHREQVRELEDVALNDNLTRLGNHRAYNEDLRRAVADATRGRYDLTLALVDVDDLKVLNDQRGHLHGDEILKSLGTLLRRLDRSAKAYRIGGDEFSLIFEHTSQDGARAIMECARRDAVASLQGATISVGIATLCDPAHAADTLHARADAALYATKQTGRDGVTVYDDSDKRLSLVSPARIAGWHAMVEEKEIGIAFQPIWDVETRSIVAYEALARPAKKYGFAEPRQAFDFAERLGRAYELDEICLATALRTARPLPHGALLFLNVSPQSLHHHRFDPAGFTAAVRDAGHSPDRVVIEITERAILQVSGVIDVVKRLRASGFRIALDDTGAGNAGLELLSRLPLDFVKIDRDVVVQATTDRSARGVIAGIVAIAEATGAYVIAEGIENVEMLAFVCDPRRDVLQKRGILGLQGYALGKPSDEFLTDVERDVIADSLAAVTFAKPEELAISLPSTP